MLCIRSPRFTKFVSFLGLSIALLLLNSPGIPSEAEPQQGGGSGPLQLRPGDHISIIGNTLADRMQHDGWLETYLYARFPQHDLVMRNLGFSADEVGPLPSQPKAVSSAKGRMRSSRFGSPEQWLTACKTDVIFAFFGYNESFAGDAGLASFKTELTTFIKRTTSQKYGGKNNARLVLFSPIAHENLHSANLPDGVENNKRLEKYATAMAEVAKANKVPFVDLFHASQQLYAKSKQPLTINGIHLTELGNKLIAQVIDKALFAEQPQVKDEHLESIRKAVLEKNFYWFNRYRTLDGYSIFGQRADLKFVNGQTNKEVMQREMEVLDGMTANRDKFCWAAAQGKDLKVADSNLPKFIPVTSNKKGPLPGGKHDFLDGSDAIKKMTIGKGLKVNLFASEKEFPELVNPVQMAWDTKGRLWVAVWPTYPHWKPGQPMNDKLLIFEDTKGTGKADKCTVFADNLHCPTGFEFYNGGVILAQAPNLMFLKDSKGTGKADMRVRLLSGLDSADTHHTSNSFVLDPGGGLYFQEGTFHHTQVETPWGPPVRNRNAGVYRYEPRTQKFEVYVNTAFANPHGHVFDHWGQDIVMDGTGAEPYDAAQISGQTADMDQRHPRKKELQVYNQKTRPCAGVEILSSRHFPESMQGNLLVLNVIGFQGILRYKLSNTGGGLKGAEMDYILKSSDPNFRPSDIKMGPDGAIYFGDWHNPLIGHMQHNLRDPSRDQDHGRIYRVTYDGRPLLKPTPIEGQSIDKLLDVLKEPEDRVRYRARIELGGRDTAAVIAATKKWIETLDSKDPNYEHHMMEALWLHQSHNIVNVDLLRRMLRSPDWHARAAATRVLCYWRDQIPEPLEMLRLQVNDSQPRVRLEAVRALSFFGNEAALAVAVEVLSQPTDSYLNFVFNETLNTLERRVNLGSKLNRTNIAVSLLSILEKGKLDDGRKLALLETVCRHGTEKELQVIWERTLDTKSYPPALRVRALEWLADAASTRRVQPKVPANDVLQLLREADSGLLPNALGLAAAWKVKEAADDFRKISGDAKKPHEIRVAAMDGLAALRDAASLKALRELTGKDQPLNIQFHAAVALAQVDLDEGARVAAAALARPEQDFDPDALVQAFLNRKDGSDKLAEALDKQALSPDTAKRILRSMFLAGRNDASLANVVSRFAKLDAAPKVPTPAEIQDYVKEVAAKGDPARGERIFLRPDLGCIKCHAINKVGGNIGPDLGPIGGSSPVDYVVSSILDPNAAIKEEYLTKVITTTTGKIVTGVVVERNKNVIVLKDATGQLVRIAIADIDIGGEANGKSLMPDGITRTLTKAEVLDLIRFVSDLGKPGPYAVHTPSTVQRWKMLRTVTTALADGIPSRDVVKTDVLAKGNEAWEIVYAPFNGQLALSDLPRPGKAKVMYLQGEVQVTRAGAVELLFESSTPATVWIDDNVLDKSGKGTVQLAAGRHRVTVRVEVASATAPTMRLELRKPANSKANFEVVQMD